MTRWISIYERLPDSFAVWVATGPLVHRASLLYGDWLTDSGSQIRGVTHWMPIVKPDPPEAPTQPTTVVA